MNTTQVNPKAEPATARLDQKETEVGSVFVSNYPPYSFWDVSKVPDALDALNTVPTTDNTLGLYLHIPFCRKRCKFCYFRVYTDKNAAQIETYIDTIAREIELHSRLPAVRDRSCKFVYFGGGTPSYISVKHLRQLADRVKSVLPWETAEEITFECEPGTLSESKLNVIREIGVTRLSLGIENFNDMILQENGRAHLSKEIYQVLPWIKQLGFEQVNVDLIAGMVGETWETWRENVRMTIASDPDSVTIYQMELPFNTVFTKMLSEQGSELHVADWQTKREWHDYAIEELLAAGYEISSAYTMVKRDKKSRFVYRDAVWFGTDMLGTGVASFSHMSGVHFQNSASWDEYIGKITDGELPVTRAFVTTETERMVRELILQLKLGKLDTAFFKSKFNLDVTDTFAPVLDKLKKEGMLDYDSSEIQLTRQGLLRVDGLLPEFYHERYKNARYT